MKSILQQLYLGELSPSDQFKPLLKEYEKKWEKVCKSQETFINELEEEKQDKWNDLLNNQLALIPLEMAQIFTDGFRLGSRIMCEVFCIKEGDRHCLKVTDDKQNDINSIIHIIWEKQLDGELLDRLYKDQAFLMSEKCLEHKKKQILKTKLTRKQRFKLDDIFSAYNFNSSEYGRVSYTQGFLDCLRLINGR